MVKNVVKDRKEFSKPKVLRVARRVLKGRKMCNNCLGRQLAHVSTGMTNRERGVIVRELLKATEPGKCSVCNGAFKKLDKLADKIVKQLKGLEFSSFLVGSVSRELVQKEEELWEEVGIEYCEPIKSEVNREVGKLLEKSLKKQFSKKPDVLVMLDLDKGTVSLSVSALFIRGSYKKLVRGIPQTKWSTYATTVEDIVAKPFMKETGATGHAFHGCGREDIDARCLDWRLFVLELKEPRKRKLSLRSLQAKVNKSKKVQVSGLKLSEKKEVVKIKAMRPDKTYRVTVKFKEKVSRGDLTSLKKLVGIINQKTPSRVLHRRADLMRKRKVKSVKGRLTTPKTAVLDIRGEAGLYIKELVTGDNERTQPSVARIVGPVEVKDLDVIKIHKNKG